MRFFGLLATAASLLASYVNAQNNALAITAPIGGTYSAGSKLTITWTPTSASSVTLQLRFGSNTGNLATGAPVAANIPNTGSFAWTIPADITSSSYSIQITDSSGVTNYSPPFTITGGSGSTSASSASSSSSASSTTTKSSSSSSSSSSASSTKTSTNNSTSTTTTSSAPTQTSTKAPNSGALKVGAGGSLAAVFGLGALIIML